MAGAPTDEPGSEEQLPPSHEEDDVELDEEIAESFPASDPPSHWSGVSGEGPTVGGSNGTAPWRFSRGT